MSNKRDQAIKLRESAEALLKEAKKLEDEFRKELTPEPDATFGDSFRLSVQFGTSYKTYEYLVLRVRGGDGQFKYYTTSKENSFFSCWEAFVKHFEGDDIRHHSALVQLQSNPQVRSYPFGSK